jgi:hypothetical protein
MLEQIWTSISHRSVVFVLGLVLSCVANPSLLRLPLYLTLLGCLIAWSRLDIAFKQHSIFLVDDEFESDQFSHARPRLDVLVGNVFGVFYCAFHLLILHAMQIPRLQESVPVTTKAMIGVPRILPVFRHTFAFDSQVRTRDDSMSVKFSLHFLAISLVQNILFLVSTIGEVLLFTAFANYLQTKWIRYFSSPAPPSDHQPHPSMPAEFSRIDQLDSYEVTHFVDEHVYRPLSSLTHVKPAPESVPIWPPDCESHAGNNDNIVQDLVFEWNQWKNRVRLQSHLHQNLWSKFMYNFGEALFYSTSVILVLANPDVFNFLLLVTLLVRPFIADRGRQELILAFVKYLCFSVSLLQFFFFIPNLIDSNSFWDSLLGHARSTAPALLIFLRILPTVPLVVFTRVVKARRLEASSRPLNAASLLLAVVDGDFEFLRRVILELAPEHVSRICNQRGETLLHVAARHNRIDMLPLLLSTVPVDSQDGFGNTALHLASAMGHLKIVKLLLAFGANPSIENAHGLAYLDFDDVLLQAQLDQLILQCVDWQGRDDSSLLDQYQVSEFVPSFGQQPMFSLMELLFLKTKAITADGQNHSSETSHFDQSSVDHQKIASDASDVTQPYSVFNRLSERMRVSIKLLFSIVVHLIGQQAQKLTLLLLYVVSTYRGDLFHIVWSVFFLAFLTIASIPNSLWFVFVLYSEIAAVFIYGSAVLFPFTDFCKGKFAGFIGLEAQSSSTLFQNLGLELCMILLSIVQLNSNFHSEIVSRTLEIRSVWPSLEASTMSSLGVQNKVNVNDDEVELDFIGKHAGPTTSNVSRRMVLASIHAFYRFFHEYGLLLNAICFLLEVFFTTSLPSTTMSTPYTVSFHRFGRLIIFCIMTCMSLISQNPRDNLKRIWVVIVVYLALMLLFTLLGQIPLINEWLVSQFDASFPTLDETGFSKKVGSQIVAMFSPTSVYVLATFQLRDFRGDSSTLSDSTSGMKTIQNACIFLARKLYPHVGSLNSCLIFVVVLTTSFPIDCVGFSLIVSVLILSCFGWLRHLWTLQAFISIISLLGKFSFQFYMHHTTSGNPNTVESWIGFKVRLLYFLFAFLSFSSYSPTSYSEFGQELVRWLGRRNYGFVWCSRPTTCHQIYRN